MLNHMGAQEVFCFISHDGQNAAKAALHDLFGGSQAGTFQEEMIQVTAVGVEILEKLVGDE